MSNEETPYDGEAETYAEFMNDNQKEKEAVDRFVTRFNFEHGSDKELVMLVESGSGTFGFKTPESDLDLRGIFMEKPENLLGLGSPRDVVDGFTEDRMVDWQIFEMNKFLGLLLKSNFNVMEWVFTPNQYINKYPYAFAKIAEKCFSKKIGTHARGWAYQIYKMDWNKPKKCLYAIRPLMVYLNLIEEEEIVSDITVLAEKYDIEAHVEQLITLHRHGNRTPEDVKDRNHKLYLDLVEVTKEAEKGSWLPDKPDKEAFEYANKFLIKRRKEMMAHD